jgi:NADPH:quinone reductase-like Zn-dependent oxidoreductase
VRAAVIERVGEGPALRDVEEPARHGGEALVGVAAAPLNPIDISIAAGRFYGGTPDVPYVPGREGLGRVVEGDGLVAGTRVWFTGGGNGGGSMAERAAVDERAAVPVPEGVDDPLAACLGIAGLAGWLALEWRAELRRGEKVLVLGASGPVGQVAVQAAKLLGAGRVVAAARDPGGLERARELGADAAVSLASGDEPGRLAEAFRDAAGGDVDVTVDPLWGAPAAAAAHAAAGGGRIVQLGQSASPEATLPSALIRGKLLSILGHTTSAAPREVQASAYRRMAEDAAAGRLTMDHEVLPLEEVAEAWERQAAFPRRKLVLAP